MGRTSGCQGHRPRLSYIYDIKRHRRESGLWSDRDTWATMTVRKIE